MTRLSQRLRDLDDRVLGNRVKVLRRRTALRLGVLLFAFAVACWIGSFWDGSLARSAATTGLIAGVILGRVQEHDLAARGQGLVPDEEP